MSYYCYTVQNKEFEAVFCHQDQPLIRPWKNPKKNITLRMSSNTVSANYLQKLVQCELLLHATIYCLQIPFRYTRDLK